MVTTIGMSCRVGPVYTVIVFFCVVAPFYFHHWEEKFTGELILGQFDGPTESQAFVMFLHVTNGILALRGQDIWNATIVAGQPGKVVFTLGFCFLCVLSSIKLQLRLWSYLARKRISFVEGLSTGTPFIIFLATAVVYTAYTPELLQHHRWDESRLLFFYLTILFGYLTSRLIVQRVCKEPSPVIYPVQIPLIGVAAFTLLHRFGGVSHSVDPHVVLKVIAVITAIQCLSFFRSLNNELTAYLGIDTFHIPFPAKKAAEKKTRGRSRQPTKTRAASKSPAKKTTTKSPARKQSKSPAKKAATSETRARSRSARRRK